MISRDGELRAIQEFFELFKTPWEFYRPDHEYTLVLATADDLCEPINARVVVVYNSRAMVIDDQLGIVLESTQTDMWVACHDAEWPIYGNLTTFRGAGSALARQRESEAMIATKVMLAERLIIRIGFDLFAEVAFLLSRGQPAANAHVPTMDYHIALFRAIMLTSGISFIEIPPRPSGYDFMACLTHDVDFVGLRDHKFDHTMFGFLYRTFAGSLRRAVRGQLSWDKCWQNWKAGLAVPFVHLGCVHDFWLEFDRYMEIERGLGATFFFIPFKNVAGESRSGPAPQNRAAKYDIVSLKEKLHRLMENGCEIGLHGIDAWRNPAPARSESSRIRELTGQSEIGARMHWLYWDDGSASALEQAGLKYDSTCGYNGAIGFWAGTTQPFHLWNAESLLEIPLNIQDTALFYSDRMALSEGDALNSCNELTKSVSLFGGVLTLNWHTRSLSPERLWGDFYLQLLREIKKHAVWFGTVSQICEWFQARRALRFCLVRFDDNHVQVSVSGGTGHSGPSFVIRIHHPRSDSSQSRLSICQRSYTDVQWDGEEVLEIPYPRPSYEIQYSN